MPAKCVATFLDGIQFFTCQANPNGVIAPIALGSWAIEDAAGLVRWWLCTALPSTWVDIGTIGGGTPLSSVTAATGANVIDNTNWAQEWDWSSLTAGTSLLLTAAALTSGSQLSLTSISVNQTGTNLLVQTASTSTFANGAVRINGTGIYTGGALLQVDGNVTTAGNLVNINGNLLAGGNGVVIASTGTALTGNLLSATSASTGAFTAGMVRFNASGLHTGAAVQIDTGTQTGTGLLVNINAQTTGVGIDIATTLATSTGPLLRVTTNSTGLATSAVVSIVGTGVTHTGDLVRIADSTTVTPGVAFHVVTNGLTTGTSCLIDSTSGTLTGPLLSVNASATTSAFTNGCVRVQGGAAFTGNLVQLDGANALTASAVLRVTTSAAVAGDTAVVVNTSAGQTGRLLGLVSNCNVGLVASTGIIDINLTGTYTTGSGISLRTASASGKGMEIVMNAQTSGTGLLISTTNAAATGRLLDVTTGSTGNYGLTGCVAVTASLAHTGTLVTIVDATTAGTAFSVVTAAITGGKAVDINDGAGTGLTGNLLNVVSASTGNTATGVVHFGFTGGARTGVGFVVLDASTGAGAMLVNASALTATGTALGVVADVLTTGTAFSVSSINAAATGNLLVVTSSSTGPEVNGVVRFNFAAHTNNGFQIDDATVTGVAVQLNTNAMTSGTSLAVLNTKGALQTGSLVTLTSSATTGTANVGVCLHAVCNTVTTGSMVVITSSSAVNVGTSGLLQVSNTSGATTGNIVNFQASTAAGAVMVYTATNRLGVGQGTPLATLHVGGGVFTDAKNLVDTAAPGVFGNGISAALSVDTFAYFRVNQTTGGALALTIPSPTDITAGRHIFVTNVGTQAFSLYTITLTPSATNQTSGVHFVWDGNAWSAMQ